MKDFRRRMLWAGVLLPLVLAALSTQQAPTQPKKEIVALTLEGIINPISQRYVERGLETAEEEKAVCLLLRLNSHGGLMGPMEKIVEAFLNAKVPVIVYISPEGAKASSAACFITLAGHVAAMAPNTTIGSASVVMMGAPGERPEGGKGEEEESRDLTNVEAERRKAMNFAVSLMSNIAETRGRNKEWALEAVREARNDTAAEALRLGAIDVMARDTEELVRKVNGRKVKVGEKEVVLETEGAPVRELPMSPSQRLLFVISDINVAYILLMLGFYGLIYEFANPGAVLPGVAGAICLILGLVSLSAFPINYAGAFLLVLGFALLVTDLFVPSHGMLTVGGLAALVFGSLMLVDVSRTMIGISYWVIGGVVGTTGAFFVFALGKAILAQRRKVTTGSEGVMGLSGIATRDIDPEGQVFVDGSYWKARTEGEAILRGEAVVVRAVEGLTLTVGKKDKATQGGVSSQAAEARDEQ